ncbi:MAG: helix-turn-helix domain-containing protein [Candidatus Didemnitutus sp.]|nr:helix-turn-helix domain-containing protein [Candidatus Didemnitutus sp.]
MTTRIVLLELQVACRALQVAVDGVLGTLPADSSAPRVERIVVYVADAYGYTLTMLQGRDRHARVSEARHVAIYLARLRTEAGVEVLGRLLHRDHGTISYAAKAMRERIECDQRFAARVRKIGEALAMMEMEMGRDLL